MVDRIGIALMTGAFGVFTGMFAWWCLSWLPGVDLAYFAPLSVLLGAVCFVLGLWRPDETINALGAIGKFIWRFATEVLSWFRLLMR